MLQQFVMETAEAQCRLRFNSGKVLKSEGTSIFDPETKFEPALLHLHAVKSICWEPTSYQLNSTVVDFGAVPSTDNGYIEFYFDLTGGTDPESFLVRVKVLARDFAFGTVAP